MLRFNSKVRINFDIKYGFVAYRDHPPEEFTYLTKIQDLCSAEEIINFILQQNACGGGDVPEAVLDGLYQAVTSISYRENSLRFLVHIADA